MKKNNVKSINGSNDLFDGFNEKSTEIKYRLKMSKLLIN